MDSKSKSEPWQPADTAIIADKSRLIDDMFQKHHLSRLEMWVPEVGLFKAPKQPMSYVKRQAAKEEILITPMRLVMTWDPGKGLRRELVQVLTKPMQTDAAKKKEFFYKISPREEVTISRLIAGIKDINKAIDSLITEANRFYLLYCYPHQ